MRDGSELVNFELSSQRQQDFANMPLQALDALEKSAAMSAAASDLKWVLAENGVEDDVQCVLSHNRFKTLKLFTGLGETRVEVRESLREMGLVATDGLPQRQQIATVLSAWTAAKDYISKGSTARAEARAHRMPRPIGPTEYQAMRQAVETQYGKIKNAEAPSKSYVGVKAENVEDNEIIAEELTEVTSKSETEVDMLTATLGEGGTLVVKKGTKHGKNPTGTEELRTKLTIMNNCWLYLKTKHSNRPWLADFDDRVFKNLADHILGETIYGLRSHNSNVEVGPSWSMILKYEHELRKRMAEHVTEGSTLKEAAKLVVDDHNLRDLYIVTPLALSGKKQFGGGQGQGGGQKRGFDEVDNANYYKGGKRGGKFGNYKGGKGKGKGRGKGKGKGGTQIDMKRPKTRVGNKPICFKFNNADETCDGACKMLHVCQLCLSPDHPRSECPN